MNRRKSSRQNRASPAGENMSSTLQGELPLGHERRAPLLNRFTGRRRVDAGHLRLPQSTQACLDSSFTSTNNQTELTKDCASGREISERMAAESQLWYLARYDLLTGLPNRSYFSECLAESLAHAQIQSSQIVVLFLDIDHFKNINDSLGHDAGDKLLRAIAKRIALHCRKQDLLARIGGDEFAIILETSAAEADSVENTIESTIAQNILSSLAEPFYFDEHELFASASIGIARSLFDGTNVDDLTRAADTAMYRAKESGRNCFRFFSWDMSIRVHRRLSMETELRHALDRNEFFLHYQPLTNAVSGKINSVEALIRWNHPKRGVVGPVEFIPILEECGMINAVSEWVLRSACIQLKDHRDSQVTPVRFAINLSAQQFSNSSLLNSTRRIISETGVDAQNLVFEITESVLVRDALEAKVTLGHLKDMGVQIAIDDFGTGYSSLGYLKHIPVDILKIDRAFIFDLSPTSKNAALIRAIVTMAHALGLEVVAEGVETVHQLALLREYGCDQIQGFYVSAPLAAEELKAMLNSTNILNIEHL